MKKRFLIIFTAFLLVRPLFCAVSHFRTPAEFIRLGYPSVNFQVPSQNQSYIVNVSPTQPKYNIMTCCARPWAFTYCRFASEAFGPDGNTSDDLGDCTSKVPLANLWFGKDSFRGEEAFGGLLLPQEVGCPFNPFLTFSHITPRLEYFEKGATIGVDLQCCFCGECYVFGVRVALPYKYIKVNASSICEEDLKDVIRDCAFEDFNCFVPKGTCTGILEDGDFAYRLDFLATITEYSSLASPNPTKIGGNNVGDPNPVNTPIYLIKRSDATFPPAVQVTGANPGVLALGKVPSQVSGQLAVDGSGIDDAAYHFGGGNIDYLDNVGVNRDEQRTLFVVPQMLVNGGGQAELTPGAKTVKKSIIELVESVLGKGTAVEFLARNCRINLKDDEHTSGLGDIWTQFYGGYKGENVLLYTFFGVTFPTGVVVNDARRVYKVPTGNNGHFAIEFGAEASLMMGLFGLLLEGSFNHVLSDTETKAAPFAGSTVRNIGPNIDADVDWNYWVLRADLALFHPSCAGFGALFGYELFSKSKDSVVLSADTAIDCFGTVRTLDATILEEGTDSLAHKIRGEIFYSSQLFRTFFGASYVFSGRSVMSEVEAHIGVIATF